MKAVALIIMGAVLVEALIEYVKTIWNMIEAKAYKTAITQLISILLGIFVAHSFGLQLFNWVVADMFSGFSLNRVTDVILTGILISRGSNYTSDLIGRLTKKENLLGQLIAIQEDGFGFDDDDEYEDEDEFLEEEGEEDGFIGIVEA